MTKLPKHLFCSNCGTALPKNLMSSLVLGEIAYCEGCGQKFQLNFTSNEADNKEELNTGSKRNQLINWEKTGVDLQQNMKKLGKNIQKVTKNVGKQMRKSIKTATKVKNKIVKETEKIGKEVKKFIED